MAPHDRSEAASRAPASGPASPDALDEGERSQISGHLDMTPRQRLQRLLDLLAFEERARGVRVIRKLVE